MGHGLPFQASGERSGRGDLRHGKAAKMNLAPMGKEVTSTRMGAMRFGMMRLAMDRPSQSLGPW